MDLPFVPYDFQRLPQPALDALLKSFEEKASPVKQVLTTILNCAKDATQTIYSLDIDSFEDDILIIRADLFLEFLKQEIEKLDE